MINGLQAMDESNSDDSLGVGDRVEVMKGKKRGICGYITRYDVVKLRWAVRLDDGAKILCRKTCLSVISKAAEFVSDSSTEEEPFFDSTFASQLPDPQRVDPVLPNFTHRGFEVPKERKDPVKLKVGETCVILDPGAVSRNMNRTDYLEFPNLKGWPSAESVKIVAGEDYWKTIWSKKAHRWSPEEGMRAVVVHIWEDKGFVLIEVCESEPDEPILVVIREVGIGSLETAELKLERESKIEEERLLKAKALENGDKNVLDEWKIIMDGIKDSGAIGLTPEVWELYPKIHKYVYANIPPSDVKELTMDTFLALYLFAFKFYQREKQFKYVRVQAIIYLKEALQWNATQIQQFVTAMSTPEKDYKIVKTS